jgi:lysophospholipase L1-like esterase
MTHPGSSACDEGARHHAELYRLSRGVRLGVAFGLAVSLASLTGCGEDDGNAAEGQGGALVIGSGGSSPEGQGEAGTSSTGAAAASPAGVPSTGMEGALPGNIPLGGGGAGGSPEATGAAGVGGAAPPADAGLPPAQEPAAFAPCPTDGTPCRVMPLGDSITDGIDMTIGYASNGGYRLELFRLAASNGHAITFVGTQPPNGPNGDVAGQPFPRNHEGISGNTIQQVAARVDAALAANPPHIVLLQIGTNNLYQGMGPDVPGQLSSLIDQITDGAPEALVAVAQVTPLGGQFPNNGVDEYNASILGIVQERLDAGKHLIVVDQFTRIATTDNFVAQLLPDNIHPNAAGYAIMGETWYGAIEAFLP